MNEIRIHESPLIYIKKEKGKLFLSNAEEMMELENDHLETILVITDSGKNHQWMLKQW